MGELDRLVRELADQPEDADLWRRAAQLVARGLPPPEALRARGLVQLALDRLWAAPADRPHAALVLALLELEPAASEEVPEAWRGRDVVGGGGAPYDAASGLPLRALLAGEEPVELAPDRRGWLAPGARPEEPGGLRRPLAPDGPWPAVAAAPYRAPTWELEREPPALPAPPDPATTPAHPGATGLVAGPDPDRVVSVAPGECLLWDLAAGAVRAAGAGPAALSPDGGWLALGDGDGVRLVPLEGDGERRVGGLGGRVADVRFDAAGDLWALDLAGVLLEVSPEEGPRRVMPLWEPPPPAGAARLTRHGLVLEDAEGVTFADDRGRPLRRFPGRSLRLVGPGGLVVVLGNGVRAEARSPGGELLWESTWAADLVGAAAGLARVAFAEPGRLYLHEPANDLATQPLRILAGGPPPAAAFLPGGAVAVLTAGGLLRRWSPADGGWEPAEDLRGVPGGVVALAVSPDGAWWAVASGEGPVELREAAGGALVARVAAPGWPVEAVGFSRDGRRLGVAGAGDERGLAGPLAESEGAPRLLAVEPCDEAGWARADVPRPPPWRVTPMLDVLEVTATAGHEARREVALGLADGTVELRRAWAQTQAPRRRVRAHQGPVRAFAYAPAGDYLLSGGADGRVVVHPLGPVLPGS